MCTGAVCFPHEQKAGAWFTACLAKLKPDGVLAPRQLFSLSACDADLRVDAVSPLGWWNPLPFSQFQPARPSMRLVSFLLILGLSPNGLAVRSPPGKPQAHKLKTLLLEAAHDDSKPWYHLNHLGPLLDAQGKGSSR